MRRVASQQPWQHARQADFRRDDHLVEDFPGRVVGQDGYGLLRDDLAGVGLFDHAVQGGAGLASRRAAPPS